jgi:hypothetical protein
MGKDPIAAYEAVGTALARSGNATPGKMMGMPTLYVGGKAFAGYFDGDMVFKLGGDAHAAALAMKGAHLFDPSNMGRPMKEWVVVPKAHAAEWSRLGRQALDYVAAATARKK